MYSHISDYIMLRELDLLQWTIHTQLIHKNFPEWWIDLVKLLDQQDGNVSHHCTSFRVALLELFSQDSHTTFQYSTLKVNFQSDGHTCLRRCARSSLNCLLRPSMTSSTISGGRASRKSWSMSKSSSLSPSSSAIGAAGAGSCTAAFPSPAVQAIAYFITYSLLFSSESLMHKYWKLWRLQALIIWYSKDSRILSSIETVVTSIFI